MERVQFLEPTNRLETRQDRTELTGLTPEDDGFKQASKIRQQVLKMSQAVAKKDQTESDRLSEEGVVRINQIGGPGLRGLLKNELWLGHSLSDPKSGDVKYASSHLKGRFGTPVRSFEAKSESFLFSEVDEHTRVYEKAEYHVVERKLIRKDKNVDRIHRVVEHLGTGELDYYMADLTS